MAEPIVSASTTFPPNPLEILQNLIRFDTTNPPGNERECVGYIQALLEQAGLETTIRSRSPSRPNLIARVKGTGQAPPLLLHGHVDVVQQTPTGEPILPSMPRLSMVTYGAAAHWT